MAVIDIGAGATDRGSSGTANYTYLDLTNPSNDSGVLDTFEIWLVSNGTVKIGTFYGTQADYTNRDFESLGIVSGGSKQTFTGKNCTVNSSDSIALFCSAAIERDTSGFNGLYRFSGDAFDGSSHNFSSYYGGDAISIYATGATVEAGSLPLKNVFGRPFSGVFR